MVALSSSGGLIFDYFLVVAFLVYAIVMIVLVYRRMPASAAKAANWPETQGTIQSVNRVMVNAGRSSYLLDVGDFSYKVNDEFYSGRTTVSRGSSANDHSTKDLVDQKVRVLYDPKKPETFSFPKQEVGGFLLSPYAEMNATDVDPIDLNIA